MASMHSLRKFLKRFGTDIAGYTCLLLMVPVGWLPGPGGIPLLIAGLGLLSVHNPWAKRLLDYVKLHSDSLRAIFFPRRKNIERAWDIFAVLMFITAFTISIESEILLISIGATIMGAASTTIFMFNRRRLEQLQRKFSRKR